VSLVRDSALMSFEQKAISYALGELHRQNEMLPCIRAVGPRLFDIKSATVTDPPYVLEGHARSVA
jgi:hypothetical protein